MAAGVNSQVLGINRALAVKCVCVLSEEILSFATNTPINFTRLTSEPQTSDPSVVMLLKHSYVSTKKPKSSKNNVSTNHQVESFIGVQQYFHM